MTVSNLGFDSLASRDRGPDIKTSWLSEDFGGPVHAAAVTMLFPGVRSLAIKWATVLA